MSWHDAARNNEPAEDSALRTELQGMLGLPPDQQAGPSPTPESNALAQSLYREALRRRRTASAHKPRRTAFLLAAAAVPLFLAITGIGAWGVQQKLRADKMAAKALELETRQNRIDAAREASRSRHDLPALVAQEPQNTPAPASRPDSEPGSSDGELVKPEAPPAILKRQPDQYRVNDSR